MTPSLIETVFALPLPVRLALLDADPTGAGWLCFTTEDGKGLDPHLRQLGESERKDKDTRTHVEWGIPWIPRNPLAVIEVAARLLAQRHGLTPSIKLLGPDGAEGEPDWTCRLVVTSDIQVEVAGSREEIGVLVLREVVNA